MKKLGPIALALAWSLFAGPVQSLAQEKTTTQPGFVFVKIAENIQPLDRGAKYEDPLNDALSKAGLGEVTGGGSQLSAPDSRGKRSIEWVGIDVDLYDLDRGLVLLKGELLRLGAPPTTVLQYQRGGKSVEESLK